MLGKRKYLVAIAGPTAVGKTALSITLAKALDCEIISCDSRQFYREMSIGTAKPSEDELNMVPHHFIDSLSVTDEYTVMDFEKDAISKIQELHFKSDVVIMVGGSGLFYNAVCHGFDEIPEVDSDWREKLNKAYQEHGIQPLQEELREKDPELYHEMDIQNPQRLIRALEVIRGTGKKYSSFRKGQRKQRPFDIIKVGLEMERELLYERIDERVDGMIDAGLLSEVKALRPHKSLNALQTVGYSEVFSYLEGDIDWEESVRLVKRNSRRYAKRQFTWFKRDEEMKWFNLGEQTIEDVVNTILKQLKSHSSEVK